MQTPYHLLRMEMHIRDCREPCESDLLTESVRLIDFAVYNRAIIHGRNKLMNIT